MRLPCSALVLVLASLTLTPAQAQVLRRADDMAPVAAPAQEPPKQAVKRRRSPKPADATELQAAARASAQDVAACGQMQAADAAIAGCARVIADDKQKPKGRAAAFYNRANAHAAKGDHAAAIADYDEAIKLAPKNPRAYNNRGTSRADSGEADPAIADFSEAIRQDARFASAYLNRANAYAAKGETARALEDYASAIRLNRRSVNAYLARGALLLAGGETVKARADLKQAVALERHNAYALLWHDIAERRGKQKGVLAADRKATKGLDMKTWPAPVVQLFSGDLKPDALLSAADNPSAAVKTAQTCEANFYGGEHALIDGKRDEAVKLFTLAAKECPRGFLEGIAAAAELKALGEKAAN